jgi:translation elongation factor EF-G
LCDGAVVVVDVVEGVCAQTKVVLKQVWLEHIKPVLVLNKIDRLITEMKMQRKNSIKHQYCNQKFLTAVLRCSIRCIYPYGTIA